jgi:dihydrofolate synthase / folylpolyglutamate synthase
MNYAETLNYLFSQLPMYQRQGAAAFKKDLTNTIALCELLNNPQRKFKSVHIAGTNGKGSVSHMLASVFQSAGYKTGLYTSPHLTDFRERLIL